LQGRTVCFLLIVLLAGCGGAGPKSDPEAIAQLLKDAAQAVADRDGGKACGYLTPAAQQEVVRLGTAFGGADCPRVVEAVTATLAPLDRSQIKDAQPQNIAVTGTSATAAIVVPSSADQGRVVQLTLQKVGADWKISSVQL
jgi:hypothetical protein